MAGRLALLATAPPGPGLAGRRDGAAAKLGRAASRAAVTDTRIVLRMAGFSSSDGGRGTPTATKSGVPIAPRGDDRRGGLTAGPPCGATSRSSSGSRARVLAEGARG